MKARVWCSLFNPAEQPYFQADWQAQCPCGELDLTSWSWESAYSDLIGHLSLKHPRTEMLENCS